MEFIWMTDNRLFVNNILLIAATSISVRYVCLMMIKSASTQIDRVVEHSLSFIVFLGIFCGCSLLIIDISELFV